MIWVVVDRLYADAEKQIPSTIEVAWYNQAGEAEEDYLRFRNDTPHTGFRKIQLLTAEIEAPEIYPEQVKMSRNLTDTFALNLTENVEGFTSVWLREE